MFGKNPYHQLTSDQIRNLTEFFDNIVIKTAIDHNDKEIRDILDAVSILLGRAATNINERGIFKLLRIQLCGSMKDHTSVWKLDRRTGEAFIEIDFLAIFDDTFERKDSHQCLGCHPVLTPPVDLEPIGKYYKTTGNELKGSINVTDTIDNLFMQELSLCLTSSCKCLTVTYSIDKETGLCNKLAVVPRSSRQTAGCLKCTVELPTGILRVNTSAHSSRYGHSPELCSVSFMWTSKTKRLPVPVGMALTERKLVTNLPVYIDFIPALEALKRHLPRIREHDKLLVSKRCGLRCGRGGWRKSSCIPESEFISSQMSEGHRTCYKIVKSLIQIPHGYGMYSVNQYHVKTIALQHSRKCSKTSKNYVKCVLKMFEELRHAYEINDLKGYDSHVNLLSGHTEHYVRWNKHHYQDIIERLCSVSETDTWETFAQKILSKKRN